MARCPDCNKFVGLENGDPEVDMEMNLEGERKVGVIEEQFSVSGTAHLTRNCAECGSELKTADLNLESEMQTFTHITPECDGELHCDFDDGLVDESGGGRYAKNMISCSVHWSVTCSKCQATLQNDVEASEVAGAFEEAY